ncbi:uncharacterized protein ISCGN_004013, partial [Ixodes scapularis]
MPRSLGAYACEKAARETRRTLELLGYAGDDDAQETEHEGVQNSPELPPRSAAVEDTSEHCRQESRREEDCDKACSFGEFVEGGLPGLGASECSEAEEGTGTPAGFQDSLREWAIDHGIKRRPLTALLKLLRSRGGMPDLPNDGRTLLQTPRRPHEQFPIRTVEPGKYCHFGLAAGLQHALCHVEKLPAVLSLTFNIDGLPLSKSSKMQLWPIQCLVGGIDDVAPFLVGAFAGHSKPMSSNDFLVTFVEELQALLSQGVTVNGSLVQVKMRYAIVEFLGLEQVEVVPALWVDDDRCAWPKHIKGDKVTAMVRKAAPPDALWQQFDVSVKGLFATYEQARKKLERSQYTSDLSSDNEMPPGKRVRRPPPQWSESDADPAPARPTKKVQRRVPTVPSDFPQAMVSSVQMQSSSSTGSENAGNLPDHPGSSSDDPCVHGDRQSRASSFEAFDDSNLTDIVTDIGGSQESVSFNE